MRRDGVERDRELWDGSEEDGGKGDGFGKGIRWETLVNMGK